MPGASLRSSFSDAETEGWQAVAAAKERLLLVHLQEMEELYAVLQEKVRALEEQKQENERTFLATIQALARTLEAKDKYTEGHSQRVAAYAAELAEFTGSDPAFRQELRLAATLHDLGKIGVSENVLLKPGRLTDNEFAAIKQHPVIGARILQPLEPLRRLIPAIKHHHEHYDGTGYPAGLAGEAIPLGARYIALADSFDAMTTDRPYRAALPWPVALREIAAGSGRQFAPDLARAWLQLYKNRGD